MKLLLLVVVLAVLAHGLEFQDNEEWDVASLSNELDISENNEPSLQWHRPSHRVGGGHGRGGLGRMRAMSLKTQVERLTRMMARNPRRLLNPRFISPTNFNLVYHSILPHHGEYKGLMGLLTWVMRGSRILQVTQAEPEVETVSESHMTAVLKLRFSGKFLENEAEFTNGFTCMVLEFEPLMLRITRMEITDLDMHKWAVHALPRIQTILDKATLHMMRRRNGIEHNVQDFVSSDVKLTVHIFPPNVLSSTEFTGIEGIEQGFRELMTNVGSNSCMFGLQNNKEQSRAVTVSDSRLDRNDSSSEPERVSEHNDTRREPAVPEQPEEPGHEAKRNDTEHKGRWSAALLQKHNAILCNLDIRVMATTANAIFIRKSFKGDLEKQVLYETITIDDSGKINDILLVFANPLKPWQMLSSVDRNRTVHSSELPASAVVPPTPADPIRNPPIHRRPRNAHLPPRSR